MENTKTFHEELKEKMDEYVHVVYRVTKNFPKDELYGVTSQLRRATLSVILNYVEGFARDVSKKNLVYKNFLEISFGSLKESEYLIGFCLKENYLTEAEYKKLTELSSKIGAMLWGILRKI
ncbi:MAG: four helix bundle protein [Candidatus Doudnabacteria bacterium]